MRLLEELILALTSLELWIRKAESSCEAKSDCVGWLNISLL